MANQINKTPFVRPKQWLPGQPVINPAQDRTELRTYEILQQLETNKIETGVVNQSVGSGFTCAASGDVVNLQLSQSGPGWTGARLLLGSGIAGKAGAGWEIQLLDSADFEDVNGNCLAFVDVKKTPKRRRLLIDTDGQVRIENTMLNGAGLAAVDNCLLINAHSGVGAVSAGFGAGIQFTIADSAGTWVGNAGFINLVTDAVTPGAMSTHWDIYNCNAGAGQNALSLKSNGDVKAPNGKLLTAGGLGVGNSAAGAILGTVVKKMEVFSASGVSLGFVPIYDVIT